MSPRRFVPVALLLAVAAGPACGADRDGGVLPAPDARNDADGGDTAAGCTAIACEAECRATGLGGHCRGNLCLCTPDTPPADGGADADADAPPLPDGADDTPPPPADVAEDTPPPPEVCVGVTCSGHGTCYADAGTARCSCDAGYHAEGLSCVADAGTGCDGVTCSGHGTCELMPFLGIAQCRCNPGYVAYGNTTCIEEARWGCRNADGTVSPRGSTRCGTDN